MAEQDKAPSATPNESEKAIISLGNQVKTTSNLEDSIMAVIEGINKLVYDAMDAAKSKGATDEQLAQLKQLVDAVANGALRLANCAISGALSGR